jgi:hypothetical protein
MGSVANAIHVGGVISLDGGFDFDGRRLMLGEVMGWGDFLIGLERFV